MRFARHTLLSALLLAATSATRLLAQAAPLELARAAIAKGDLPAAAEQLRGLLRTQPDAAEAHSLLAWILFRQKDAIGSLAESTAAARFRQPSADELKVVASDYILLTDYADASTWLKRAAGLKPLDEQIWYMLGRTRFNLNDFSGAIEAFEQTLRLHPGHIEAENNIGLCLQESGDKQKARAAFQQAIDWQGASPTDAQPFLNLGSLLAGDGQTADAFPLLEKAAALAPENATVHEQLALAATTAKDLPRARHELEEAVRLAPDISSLHYKLGQIYRKLGLADQAREQLEICARLNGAHSSAKTPNPYTVTPKP